MRTCAFAASFALVLLVLSALAFSDVGPGPKQDSRAFVSLNVTYLGGSLPAGTDAMILCYNSPDSNRSYLLNCSGNVCTNAPDGSIGDCLRGGSMAFSFSGANLARNYTTNKTDMRWGGMTYLDVALKSDGTSELKQTSFEQNPSPSACLFFILPLILIGFAFSEGKRTLG